MSKKIDNSRNPEIITKKITLGIRPQNKINTASARSSIFLEKCYLRSESAVPLLTLNKEFKKDWKKNRPFSADCIPQKFFYLDLQSKASTANQSVESLESVPEETLPSSLLLQSLIAEPIKTWETSTEDNSKNIEETPKLTNQTILIPGILTKPPIPKTRKMSGKKINFSEEVKESSNYDPIHDYLTLKYDNVDSNKQNKKCNDSSENSSIQSINLDEYSSRNNEKTTDTNLQIQNWMQTKEDELDPVKIPNLSELDIDELFKDEVDKKFDKFFKPAQNKQKHNEDGRNKSKFIATPIKSQPDSQKEHSSDIETWIEKDEESVKSKSNNYLECLNGLDEMEKALSVELAGELPQKDNENLSKVESCEDIASLLEALEAEDSKSQMNINKMQQEIMNKEIVPKIVVTDVSAEYNKSNEQNTKFNNNNNSNNNNSNNNGIKELSSKTSSFESNSNYSQLVSYLDQIDKECFKPLNEVKDSLPEPKNLSIQLDTVPRLEDLLHCSVEELGQHIINLSLRLKDKSSSIGLLQSELSDLRQQLLNQSKKTDCDFREKLKAQKTEYEQTIKRHQKFIDQLINEKKTLNKKCEDLVKEIKVQEERHQSNLKALEHKHEVEMKKIKEMHIAGEKIQRERWINTKTEKIKQIAVKSLEPELESMEKRQQQELADLRSLHKKELEDLELKNARKMQQQLEALRMEMIEEREKCVAHEREIMRQRYESLVEAEEKGYQEQRKRLLADHALRIAECEQREAAVAVEKEKAIKQIQVEYEDRVQLLIRRHANEINLIKESKHLEMETWQNNYMKQQAMKIAELEAEIREKCRKERDREIEKVIETLEHEANENRKQIEQSTENRIKRMKEKYEKEICDFENSEKEYKFKINEMKKQIMENEDMITNLKITIKQLETQLEEAKAIATKLQNERGQVREIVKNEIQMEVDCLSKELSTLREAHDKELQQLYSRIRVSMARKDEILSELSRDHKSLQEKCLYLENMLEQQRKEYLIK